jgi:VWFA-related protein
LPTLAWAQQPAPPAASPAQSQTAPSREPNAAAGRIKLNMVVTDKSGKPVAGLDLRDFTLFDNNLPGKILSLHSVGDSLQNSELPVEVILLIDTVNLEIQSVDYAREEVEKFLRRNEGHLAQPVSVFLFTNTGGKFLAGPLADGNVLAAKLHQVGGTLRTIGQAAAGNGAIERFQLSVQLLTMVARGQAKRPGRRLLIWVGPGWPMLQTTKILTTSEGQQQFYNSIVELSTSLRVARISLYSVSSGEPDASSFRYEDSLKGVRSPEKANTPNLALKVLAIQSGGRVLGPNSDLQGQINNCFQDAPVYYTLGFDPPPTVHANEYHDLKVQIDKPGLIVHTNTGYYNQP